MITYLKIKSLPGVLALIFLLMIVLPYAAMSAESQDGQQDVLRQASLKWMQVGIEQYQSGQFSDAERSFRRALVFRKYLTDAERSELDEFLEKTRIAATEGKQPKKVTETAEESAGQAPPAEGSPEQENSEAEKSSIEEDRRQVKTMLDRISSQPQQKKMPPVIMAEPSVSKIQLAAETSGDIVVTKNEDLTGKYMQLSDWLAANRRNILIIGLPILAVLIVIAKVQGRKRRPGTRVYENPDLASSSFIGARLNPGGQSKRKFRALETRRPAAEARDPNRKSFTQSTEHWRKNAVQSPPDVKPFETNESRPQRKDKFETAETAVAEDQRKQCSKCKKLKPPGDFYKNKSTHDGLSRWCKQCKKEYRQNRQSAKK